MSDRTMGYRHPEEPQWEVFEMDDGGSLAKISPALLDELGNRTCLEILTDIRDTIATFPATLYRTTVAGRVITAWAVPGEYNYRPVLIYHLSWGAGAGSDTRPDNL